DNGVGIPEEKIPKLFNVEEKTSTEGTEKETGSGLGLALCKEFIQKHGGRIWVESQINHGTNIHFTLPKKQALPQNE
ncbi:MAG TPA: histidine kinase, partial [Bacteroidales bacterium]|nr:histidine kinase [Bacteroidales bacterium]